MCAYPELRVIVSSATLEIERFSAFFGGAPVIEVSGRTYPVDVIYRPPRDDEEDLADAVANTVNEVTELGLTLTSWCSCPASARSAGDGRARAGALPHTVILPLYRGCRRPSSNACSSACCSGASCSRPASGAVAPDHSGHHVRGRHRVRAGQSLQRAATSVSQLLVEPISRASADQRKGRCGRTANGVCFRLYSNRTTSTGPRTPIPRSSG